MHCGSWGEKNQLLLQFVFKHSIAKSKKVQWEVSVQPFPSTCLYIVKHISAVLNHNFISCTLTLDTTVKGICHVKKISLAENYSGMGTGTWQISCFSSNMLARVIKMPIMTISVASDWGSAEPVKSIASSVCHSEKGQWCLLADTDSDLWHRKISMSDPCDAGWEHARISLLVWVGVLLAYWYAWNISLAVGSMYVWKELKGSQLPWQNLHKFPTFTHR